MRRLQEPAGEMQSDGWYQSWEFREGQRERRLQVASEEQEDNGPSSRLLERQPSALGENLGKIVIFSQEPGVNRDRTKAHPGTAVISQPAVTGPLPWADLTLLCHTV